LAHCLRSSASPSPPTRPLLVSRPLFEHARALPDGVATARPPQYLEATAAGHRADFERERDRSDALMSETLKLTGIAMSAREKAARLEGELSTTAGCRRHRWWRWFGVQACRPSPSRPALAGSTVEARPLGHFGPFNHRPRHRLTFVEAVVRGASTGLLRAPPLALTTVTRCAPAAARGASRARRIDR
jgi:hypothetical protein